jgi:Cu-Zn family superoxide dismutase
MKIPPYLSAPLAFCALLLLGGPPRLAAAESASATAAIAVIQHTAGNETAGIVTFTATDGGVKVVADITGLTPGKHGFHIHEFGDISDSAKAMSTGGHFDPEGTHHHALVQSDHSVSGHHAGDMGNLVADSAGKAHLEITLEGVTLMGAVNPIVGRAVIVHAKPDDGGQPVGNAGDRVGEGVIGIARAK